MRASAKYPIRGALGIAVLGTLIGADGAVGQFRNDALLDPPSFSREMTTAADTHNVAISPIHLLPSTVMSRERSRPVWLLPAIGAAVSTTALAVSLAKECRNDDCLIEPVTFFVAAAVVGAIAGGVVEIILRVAGI